MSPDAKQRGKGWLPLVAAGMVAIGCALLFELACQVYAYTVVFPRFDQLGSHPNHTYRSSDNPVLGYELVPGKIIDRPDRQLQINRWGIRDDDDAIPEGLHKLALLGDSVVFGTGHSQESVISVLLQQELDPGRAQLEVLNFGVEGYEFGQLAEQLRVKDRIYRVDDVVFVLNLNDYARRNTMYEGADNGLYRMYRRPALKSLWFVRKAIYRLRGGGENRSALWYEWVFRGNESYGQEMIREMASYANERGMRFAIALFPAGVALTEEGYALAPVHQRIGSFLESEGIPYADATTALRPEDLDPSDHPFEQGNMRAARHIATFLRELGWVGGGAPQPGSAAR